jgi:hypothetical protein
MLMRTICRETSVADKACLLLEFHGRPMTREEILADISDEHNIRTLGNYLCDDSRFVRVNLTEYALASWGTVPYKGIVQELTAEISRCGGEASLENLKTQLIVKFGVSERSIIYYLYSPIFARTRNGLFRVRREDEDVTVQSRMELTRSCFRIDGNWGFRLQVDKELLRGSGRNLPSAFAYAFGVGPGSFAVYNSEFGEYRMSWLGAQPAIGSIRRFLEQFELVQNDWIYLVPVGSELRAIPLKATELLGLRDVDKLFRQTCPSQAIGTTDKREAIAESIGLSEDIGWTSIKRRLSDRRETALCALVPNDSEALVTRMRLQTSGEIMNSLSAPGQF